MSAAHARAKEFGITIPISVKNTPPYWRACQADFLAVMREKRDAAVFDTHTCDYTTEEFDGVILGHTLDIQGIDIVQTYQDQQAAILKLETTLKLFTNCSWDVNRDEAQERFGRLHRHRIRGCPIIAIARPGSLIVKVCMIASIFSRSVKASLPCTDQLVEEVGQCFSGFLRVVKRDEG